ncbi:hypothetical protein GCM10020219_022360 [Nonomuraea dietziae]
MQAQVARSTPAQAQATRPTPAQAQTVCSTAVPGRVRISRGCGADTERPEGLGTMVGSHGDLHPKNALLRADGSLALIDWDTAGAYVAEQEAAGVALDWSARLGGDVDLDRFDAVVEGYRSGGGVIPSEPWVFGGWVRGYLDFMRRAGTDEREQTHARLSLLAAILPDLVKRLT